MNAKQAEIDGKVRNILRNDANIFGENDDTVEAQPRKIDNPFMRAPEAQSDRYESDEEEKVVAGEGIVAFADNESFVVDEIIDEVQAVI